jgi:predicted PurR-regulated permease PerM
LVGAAFWLLNLPSPVLCGLVTAFLSLVPIIGTGGVWIPAATILMADGHWAKAFILVAWGIAVVHPVDNFLRPFLVGHRVQLSSIYLFFAILGGVNAFGLIGLLVGPVLLSVILALLGILKTELTEWTPPLSASPADSRIRRLAIATEAPRH